MKKERLFQVIGLLEDDLIKEAEDEQALVKKRFFINMAWKWAAAAAGILLAVRIGILQNMQNNNASLTSSFYESNGNSATAAAGNENGSISTTAASINEIQDRDREDMICEEKESVAGEKQGAEDSKIGMEGETIQAYAETKGEKEAGENGGYQKEIERVFLYAKIIGEIYQPYQGHVLYLNLEDGGNLSEEQREDLLKVLYSEYRIITITGSLGELSKQGIIDAKTEEIFGIYLSFRITEEEENHFSFQIDCWGGRNVIFERQECSILRKNMRWVIGKNVMFGWKECEAFYNGSEWGYRLE